ncbi:MAG: hypothetical protein AB8B99_07545 [Phormidesmis sp.]
MTASKCEISRCGLCRFYAHEGRRGGTCAQLGVPVSSQWKACCLVVSPFQSASEISEIVPGIDDWTSASAIDSDDLPMPVAPEKAIAKPKIPLVAKVPIEKVVGS